MAARAIRPAARTVAAEPDDLAFARGFLLALPISLALWAGIIATLMHWIAP